MNVASKVEFVGGQSEWEEGARQAREKAVQSSCEIVGISNSVAYRVTWGKQTNGGFSSI